MNTSKEPFPKIVFYATGLKSINEFEFNIEASLLRNKYSEQELLVQFAKSVNTLADFELAVEEMMNRLLELDIEQFK